MPIQRVSSKWEKTKVLLKNERLSRYIPETRLLSSEQLKLMLEQYHLVFIKPDRGTYGIGVMSMEQYQEDPQEPESPWLYKLRSGIESRIFNSVDEVDPLLKERTNGKPYLIQRGIELLTYENRKFDLRVLVQKNPKGAWETTGMIGRIAGQQKIITNYHSGGKTAPVEELFKNYLQPKGLASLIIELRRLGERVGGQLERKYDRLQEIGLDIAVDADFRPWILEVNTLPALFPFKWLPDKTIYPKIRKYALAYGRKLDGKKKPS
ncbi:YheC/YheD family protein [Paenibacillus pinistramenti]|uniref:YheC/YheD family protein n=1 Tax=Paenibacillus pinistramenti TaxID=1768003 RepID=UPI001107BE63|nr:YheC/YheD family protein [Paenibacillus pinistramenti]